MSESAAYFIRVLGMFLLILLLIFILAVITPKLAKKIDILMSRLLKKDKENHDDSIYKVRSIYDVPKALPTDEKKSDDKILNDGENENGEE